MKSVSDSDGKQNSALAEMPLQSSKQLAAMLIVGISIISMGAIARIYFRDLPNFSPVAAIALYAGFLTRSWWRALLVPLGVLLISDAVIGGYDLRLMAVVYSMLAFPVVLGVLLRRRNKSHHSAGTFAFGAGLVLLGSVTFFVMTNGACWAFSPWYPKTGAGLLQCYAAGLPFFRYTLIGDISFATCLFGAHALGAAWTVSRAKSALAKSVAS